MLDSGCKLMLYVQAQCSAFVRPCFRQGEAMLDRKVC